ncbi:MAG TPA: zf-HC2 domain-containing protein [Gemmatimonadales bacterium]|jgi:hypothetical protein
MHLDEERLQRLLHDELSAAARRDAHEHLAQCDACRERLVVAGRDEGEIFALLRRVDHPLPPVQAEGLVARARGFGLVWGRWAAGILLVLGVAGAAYAVPGSPVRQWIRAAAAWIAPEDRASPTPRQAEAPTARAAGIAAVPGRTYAIAFQSAQPGGQVRVSLTEGREVTVRAPAGAARFTSAEDRLLIDNQGPGATFDIEIPRTAPWVEIRLVGKRIFLKQGERVAAAQSADEKGKYVIGLD